MVEIFKIKGTEETPDVVLNRIDGHLEFSGRSLPEDAFTFYGPVIEWIREYIRAPHASSVLHFNLEYFNSASARQFMDMLQLFEELHLSGSSVQVVWHYQRNDDLMMAKGEELSSIMELPFEFREFKRKSGI